ncbi:RNA-directed DNA polymerase from mobile element jockey [Araneus ventricosus]|uniref:RNA-directed DNA polymerase from mobile element jockey n=1 Tax=Araneus ventricosus TaxID=182803 RepID=A0A4Y2LPR3_ARAVE|nr:RNA-directed DNA polymerase from mobile element jockey [Araneus ventricosus]
MDEKLQYGYREICQAMRRGYGAAGRNSTDHSPQVRTSSDSRKSKIATSTLLEARNSHNPSIILAQETYILDGRIEGIPRSWNQWLSKNNKAGIISLPSCNKPVFLQSTVNSTALKIQTEQGLLTVISAYSSPYKNIMETLQELHSILTDLGDERVLICADLNAHIRIWGYASEDTRGAQVEDFLLVQQLFLLNKTNSPPIFEHRGRKGWPDLSFTKGTDFANSCIWKVLEDYTHSDHNYILKEALLSQSRYSYPRFKTAYGGHRRMLQHLGQKTKQLVQQIEESNTKDHLAKATEELQKAIFAAYPYGQSYKAVVKNKHPPAELFKQLGNPSSGDTKSFALKILQELYPPSHSPVTPPNCFPLIQEPQITKNEIRRILKKAPTKKAPGFDAIDYIVLKEVKNSFPEILHTFYNKCYQLHCFPEPLKKGIIVLFHKDGKEADKIKSYRPVTLLPTIGKVLEQILLRRLNHTLKKKNVLHHNQFGFREGRSTDDAIHQLVEKIQDSKNKKLHTMVISLDIQGAFDYLQYN